MMNKQRGFTLIELMITMVIGVILLAVGLPSFKSITDNTRMAASANNLVMAMLLARSEAVRTGLNVYVSPLSAANGWGSGYIVGFDLDGGNDYDDSFADDTYFKDDDSDTDEEELRTFDVKANLDYESDIGLIVYEADGTVTLDTGDISDIISLQPVDCDGDAGKRRELRFENTGQVRIVVKDCETA